MSERYYNCPCNCGAYVILDDGIKEQLDASQVIAALNAHDRLAAQVETLRELLNEARLLAWKHGEIVLFTKLEAAIKQSFDNQERGEEAARDGA